MSSSGCSSAATPRRSSTLHGRNALRDNDKWKVIDPHALSGDRHAEIQPLLEASLNLPAGAAGDRGLVDGWVSTYSDAAAMNPCRAAAWARVIAHAKALAYDFGPRHTAEGAAWASGLHRLADALEASGR